MYLCQQLVVYYSIILNIAKVFIISEVQYAEIGYKDTCAPAIKVAIGGKYHEQKLILVIDTGASITWVINQNITEIIQQDNNFDGMKKFNDLAYFHEQNIEIFKTFADDSSIYGKQIYVPFQLMGTNIAFEMRIISVSAVFKFASRMKKCGFSGFLGLGAEENETNDHTNFLNRLAQYYSPWLTNRAAMFPVTQTIGTLMMGVDFQQKLISGSYTICKLVSIGIFAGSWAAMANVMIKIQNSEYAVRFFDEMPVLFDSGYSGLLAMPSEELDKLKELFENHYHIVFLNKSYSVDFYCSKEVLQTFPFIILKFPLAVVGKTIPYQLESRDYVKEKGQGKCEFLFDAMPKFVHFVGINFYKKFFVGFEGILDTITFAKI